MAYTATITIKRAVYNGRSAFRIAIAETEAAAGSESQIIDATGASLPLIGTVVWVKSTRTAGTGATIDPTLGNASGDPAASQKLVWANGTAAAHILAGPSGLGVFTTGTLYWRPVPSNAAADHTVTTEIIVVEGIYGV